MNAETEPKREQEASRFTPEAEQHQGDLIDSMENLVESLLKLGKTVR
jgi:hypothetical protein